MDDLGRLAAIPLLAGIPEPLRARGLQRCALVRCGVGVPVIEEGEHDDRFFVIVEGSCEVSRTPATQSRESISGWLSNEETLRGSLVPGRVVVAELRSGDFFGELACMSPWPRTSTVVPTAEALLLEVDDDVFDEWHDGAESFRKTMDEAYMSRGLAVLLRGMPALAPLDADGLEALARDAKVEVFSKGDVVVREGDHADAFFLLRGGSAAVSKRVDGAERTVSYLRAGSYFGETALIRGTARTATVTAASRLEVIRIRGEALREVLDQRPEVARQLEGTSERRSEATRAVLASDDVSGALSFLVAEGLMASPDLLVVDLDRCTHCGRCEDACEDSHGAALIALHGPQLEGRLFPTACRHCTDPLCLLRCPVDAIGRDVEGEVRLADHCIGCGRCQANCPWGTISLRAIEHDSAELARQASGLKRAVTHQAVKCDLCAGIGGAPRCVTHCATAAIRLLAPRDLLRPLLVKAS